MERLTEAEKILMEILWDKKRAFLKELLEAYPEPKPANTTLATLQNKNLVGYKLYGNSREYFPKVQKSKYFVREMNEMIGNFFKSSVSQFASFFTANTKLTEEQLLELKEIIEQEIAKKQK